MVAECSPDVSPNLIVVFTEPGWSRVDISGSAVHSNRGPELRNTVDVGDHSFVDYGVQKRFRDGVHRSNGDPGGNEFSQPTISAAIDEQRFQSVNKSLAVPHPIAVFRKPRIVRQRLVSERLHESPKLTVRANRNRDRLVGGIERFVWGNVRVSAPESLGDKSAKQPPTGDICQH